MITCMYAIVTIVIVTIVIIHTHDYKFISLMAPNPLFFGLYADFAIPS